MTTPPLRIHKFPRPDDSDRTDGRGPTRSCPPSPVLLSSVFCLLSSVLPGAATAWWSIARGKTPDPIPNSAVKTLSADGTASEDAEEQVAARLSQPPPAPRPEPTSGPYPAPGRSRPPAPRARNRRQTRRPAGRRVGEPTPTPGSSPGTIRGPRSIAQRGVEQPGSSSGS